MTYTPSNIHRENVFGEVIASALQLSQGYRERRPEDYDQVTALDQELLIEFVRNTQPEAWAKLEQHYPGSAQKELINRVTKALKERGTLSVLREGITIIPNIEIRLGYPKPASGLNPTLVRMYEANILSFIREVAYSTKNKNRLDMVLFLNGIPVATLELKNKATGTTFRDAEYQYKTDRPIAGEPLLTIGQGAIVHFALDTDYVTMTTRLHNGKTEFIPFNRGKSGGAGNDDLKDNFPVAYLYADTEAGKAIFSREIWLDLIFNFTLKTNDKKIIFPRYHQLDAVLKLQDHITTHGTGCNYLIQHSAGSGKSNTIGWVAHLLINLHDENDRSLIDTVIIVTDRVVLDQQLQATVASHQKTKGVVKNIDGTSKQLREALEQNARIIISTIHKFSTEHLQTLSGLKNKRFAILIDEAHSSQSGKHAENLSRVIASDDVVRESPEEIIAEYQRLRGKQPHISYIAFTATPRNVTLERFGTKDESGLPKPFHIYSMRQAIEEGFILDVLANYTTYKAYYQLEKKVEEDPELQGRKAKRKIARFAELHPTAVEQKCEVIVEHFLQNVYPLLNREAKAMIVTKSREHAIKYYYGIKTYIHDKGYQYLKPLVAFSGEMVIDGEVFTEAGINGFSETELTGKFESSEFQVLIVAEKYQTGFDQPKLCAMYIDRKLEGLQAVQTLSRLNRTAPGKIQTFILDFQNTIEDIQSAFLPYFESTSLEKCTDLHVIYDLQHQIKQSPVIFEEHIERFVSELFKPKLTSHDKARLEGMMREAVDRFNLLDVGEQESFKQLLKSYMRFYQFVAQVVYLDDTMLEKYFAYADYLVKFLPDRTIPPEVKITDEMIQLTALRIEKTEVGDASLNRGDTKRLTPVDEFGINKVAEEDLRSLAQIIKEFNERNGTNFNESEFLNFDSTGERLKQNVVK